MGLAATEAPARSSGSPTTAARAGDSPTTDFSAAAAPTAIPLAAAAGAPPPGSRPALEIAAVAPSPAPKNEGRGTGKEIERAADAAFGGARQHTDCTRSAPPITPTLGYLQLGLHLRQMTCIRRKWSPSYPGRVGGFLGRSE